MEEKQVPESTKKKEQGNEEDIPRKEEEKQEPMTKTTKVSIAEEKKEEEKGDGRPPSLAIDISDKEQEIPLPEQEEEEKHGRYCTCDTCGVAFQLDMKSLLSPAPIPRPPPLPLIPLSAKEVDLLGHRSVAAAAALAAQEKGMGKEEEQGGGESEPEEPEEEEEEEEVDPHPGAVDPGHVFVVLSDMSRLACDHYSIPLGHLGGRIPHYWTGLNELPAGVRVGHPLEKWDKRIAPVEGWPEGFGRQPWLVQVGGGRRHMREQAKNKKPGYPVKGDIPLEWFTQLVDMYLGAVADWIKAHPNAKPQHNRAKWLVAMTMFGTGGGGARGRYGDVLRDALPRMYRAVKRYGFDVALVTNERTAFAAAVAQRERLEVHQYHFTLHERALRKRAKELGELAMRGKLVLFLGAGVSVGAGLPLWGPLLKKLEDRCGLSPFELKACRKMSFLDRAKVVEKRLGGSEKLQEAVSKELTTPYHSISHAFLASMPVNECVTTNYDKLFELASDGVGCRPVVLPYESAHVDNARWLLKMHGCVDHPEDIVLTREDYIRYEEQRSALVGVVQVNIVWGWNARKRKKGVQSKLLTKHMLFCGFSLGDENFHRIMSTIRRTYERNPSRKPPRVGTSLLLFEEPVLLDCHEDICLLAMEKAMESPQGADWARASRRLEIFLDRLSACAMSNTAHIMDPNFNELLAPEERVLRDFFGFLKKGLLSTILLGEGREEDKAYAGYPEEDKGDEKKGKKKQEIGEEECPVVDEKMWSKVKETAAYRKFLMFLVELGDDEAERILLRKHDKEIRKLLNRRQKQRRIKKKVAGRVAWSKRKNIHDKGKEKEEDDKQGKEKEEEYDKQGKS